MSMKVRTPFMRDFKMPAICVACGATPAEGATKNVNRTQNYGNKIDTIAIDFPLCNECYAVSQRKMGDVRTVVFAALAAAVLIIVSAVLSVMNETAIYIILGFVMGIAVSGYAFFRLIKKYQKTFTEEQAARRAQVGLCASIKKFERPDMGNPEGLIEFDFNVPTFAEQFSKLNHGIVR